ncbi:MAG: AraC family transcriptional regulator [Planctomycetota bacterium]
MHGIKVPVDEMNPQALLAGYFIMPENYLSGIYRTPAANYYLVVEGGLADISREGEEVVATKGQILCIPPGTISIASRGNCPVAFYQASFRPVPDGDNALPWIDGEGPLPPRIDLGDRFHQAIKHCEELIEALALRESCWQLAAKSAILMLTRLIVTCQPGVSAPVGLREGNRWERLVQKLEQESGASGPSTREMAARMGMSVTHFINGFRQYTGHTPKQFLLRRRLWKARRMLLDGMMVKEAAYATGFKTQLYFSRIYKRIFGHPPSEASKHELELPRQRSRSLPASRHFISPEISPQQLRLMFQQEV